MNNPAPASPISLDASKDLFQLAAGMARAQATILPYQDLMTTHQLVELVATTKSDVIRRKAAQALYAQGKAHGMRELTGVKS